MERWQTLDEIIAARTGIIASLSGWQHPAANGIGFVPLGEEPRAEHFPIVNTDEHLLPGAIASAVLGYRRGTCVLEVSRAALDLMIQRLEPAEACTEVQHPNLWMWRDTFRSLLDEGLAGHDLMIQGVEPAEARTGVQDPNLRMWGDTFRSLLEAGVAGRVVAVFGASLDDPVAGPGDAALRAAVGRVSS